MKTPRGLFVIPSLRGGGAERVFTLVLNGLAARGFDMHVGLCQKEGFWLERLSREVTVHDLQSPRVRQAGWPLVRLIRRLAPAAAISTSSHLNTIAGLFRPFYPSATRLYLREVSIDHFDPASLRGVRGALLRRAYRSSDAVIALVDEMRGLIEGRLGVPSDRIVRIFNPVVLETRTGVARRREPPAATSAVQVLGVGSFYPPKGFDRLIAAFPALLQRRPGSTLTILGEGVDRPLLEHQIHSLGLEAHVRLPGFSSDVRSHLATADLFVLPSRYEGMPNSLLEAISERCPCAVLEHPGGTIEVMKLLGEERRLTKSLDEWRPEWFEPISEATCQRAMTHFNFDHIVDQYQNLLFPSAARSRLAA